MYKTAGPGVSSSRVAATANNPIDVALGMTMSIKEAPFV
jgi:hypothetical protein